MKKIIMICSVVLLLLTYPVLLYGSDSGISVRKDPILAGALSWYVPGLGQFYAGAFLKGAAFWVIEEALLISTILTIGELELNVTGDISLGLNIKSKDNPDNQERRIAIILGSSLIAVHFINIIDAVNTARNYNRAQEQRLFADFSYNEEDKTYSLGLKRRF